MKNTVETKHFHLVRLVGVKKLVSEASMFHHIQIQLKLHLAVGVIGIRVIMNPL